MVGAHEQVCVIYKNFPNLGDRTWEVVRMNCVPREGQPNGHLWSQPGAGAERRGNLYRSLPAADVPVLSLQVLNLVSVTWF